MSFNYFGAINHVHTYSKFRPCPPKSLVEAIVKFLQESAGSQEVAVDIGCASGQSTAILAPLFKNVIGLDPSEEIIKSANARNEENNVTYKVGSAEKTPLQNESVDLVTAAQSIHWYDLPKFYAEVSRLLKRKGVLAVYGYHLPEPEGEDVNTAPADLIRKYYEEILADFVYEESRKTYLGNYTDPAFNRVPFVEGGQMVRKEGFTTEMEVSVSDITGYISSWSGFQNFVKQRGEDDGKNLLGKFEHEMTSILGKKPTDPITVRYRYFLLLGRKA